MNGNSETSPRDIDPKLFDLYDEYCHGRMERREFFARAAALTVGGASALAMAGALFPRYAEAQTVSFTDDRIRPRYVEYPSPGGSSGTMRGYLVAPSGDGPFPAVLVVHENRGLNPHIEAENDSRINGMRADFEAALKAAGVSYEMHTYPGTRHGFHNNSTPRYAEDAAKLAWDRTIAFFRKHLT